MSEQTPRWLTFPTIGAATISSDLPHSLQFIESYRQRLLMPMTFVDPDGAPYTITPNVSGVRRRCDILYNLLCNQNPKNRKDLEATARGFLVEMVAVSVLDEIARQHPSQQGYRVFHALPQIDYSRENFLADNGIKMKDKGGDALLVQEVYKDDKMIGYRPIAIFDAKAASHSSDGDIRPGFNCRLRECLPVMIGCFGGMDFEDREGEQHSTTSYLMRRIIPAMLQNNLPDRVYWPTSDGPQAALFERVRREVNRGCIETMRYLSEKRWRRELVDELIAKAKLANAILGIAN